MSRPRRLIVVVGTHTEVGKTWVSHRLLCRWKAQGLRVAARKPAQSFGIDAHDTDAEQLALATGEHPHTVCPQHRWYPLAMAPPMAADVLGRPRIALRDLVAELAWPGGIDVGLVETAGGVRSPLGHDGDSVDLARLLQPDEVVLVADAGLGTLNAVRLATQCLQPLPTRVFLNRFDAADPLHRLNHEWLADRDGITAFTDMEALAASFRRAGRRPAR